MATLKSCLLTVVLTIFAATSLYAAFPLQPRANTAGAVTASRTAIDYNVFVNSAIEKFVRKSPPPAYGSNSHGGEGLGIASFITGLAGLVALVLSIWLPILLVFVLLAGIAAIILGAKGMYRAKRGLAIAGMALGITDLSLLLVVSFFLLVFFALSIP